jgi:hypothetical protein
MIHLVFTVDYEVYGNGLGSLEHLVYNPTEQLVDIFQKHNVRFVAFIEAAELERIEASGADRTIVLIEQQIRRLYQDAFEVALHLHPQWCNAQYRNGRWRLDYNEYNLCTLPRARIADIVDRSLRYLRHVVGDSAFTPLAFRAGNWLFQPTHTAATVLAECGIRVDSSVFKGGVLHNHGLDYRPALKNGYYWRFRDDANEPDEQGDWIELPIYSRMVAPWKVASSKRVSFGSELLRNGRSLRHRINRARDFLRFRYPLKLDFCRMDIAALTSMIGGIVLEDTKSPGIYRPIVAIGHTKDFTDPETLDAFLGYLRARHIDICTFPFVYARIRPSLARPERSSDGQ